MQELQAQGIEVRNFLQPHVMRDCLAEKLHRAKKLSDSIHACQAQPRCKHALVTEPQYRSFDKLLKRPWGQVGSSSANLPAELVRRFDVVVKPSAKQRPLRLREVSADHIGRLVILQVTSYMPVCAQHPRYHLRHL